MLGLTEAPVYDGCRQVIHYLTEVCGLSMRVLDTSLRSPLHLACSKGHVAAAVYLLKNQVSSESECLSLSGLILSHKIAVGKSMPPIISLESMMF